MQKKNLAQLILGDWNTKTVVGLAIGAALFGVLMVYGGVKVFTNTNLTTAMLIPVIVGALFGPVPALVACFFGNVIADLIGGWGFWFDWSIGNGVLGFFVGLLPLYGADINKGIFNVKHAIIFAVIAVLGNALAFGVVTPLFTLLFFGGELNITFLQSLTGGASNVLVLTVLGIPLLFALAKRNASSQNLVKE